MDTQSKEISFNERDIGRFCALTGDDNPLHQGKYMQRVHGKRVIVPGIMMLSAFGPFLSDDFKRGMNSIQAYFGTPISESEQVRIEATKDRELRLLLKKREIEQNAFAPNGNCSRVYSSGVPNSFSEEELQNARRKLIDVAYRNLREFGGIMGIEDESVRDRFFALALLSGALVDRVKDAASLVDLELQEKMGAKDGEKTLPVYTNVSVAYSLDNDLRLSTNPISLETFVRKNADDKKGRGYQFVGKCVQDNMPIYSVSGGLMVIKEGLLARGALDSTILAVA